MKPLFFIALLLPLLLLAGCARTDSNAASAQEEESQNQQRSSVEDQKQMWEENFDERSLTDVHAGMEVVIMGTENTDGSILADQIMFGAEGVDFVGMRPGGSFVGASSTESWMPPDETADRGFRPEQFQNMTEEERAQMFEHMRASGRSPGSGNRMRSGGGLQMVRLNGEVVQKDDSGLTLKLEEAGSKLVFFSGETKVFEPKKSE